MTELVVSPPKSLKRLVLELSPPAWVMGLEGGGIRGMEDHMESSDTSDTTNNNNNLHIVVSPIRGGSVTDPGMKCHQHPNCSQQWQWAAMAPGESIMMFPHADYLCFGCEKFATRLALGSIRSSLAHRRRTNPDQIFRASAASGGIRVERMA